MNSSDSAIESVQNISKLLDEDCHCTAIDENTGQFCGESGTLKIIDEFQKLYETRIENVDRELKSEFDQVCMKLEISKEWIKNLKEQNVMLVQVVEDLEQAACNRVKLLEQKLKNSSTLVSGNMTKSLNTEKTINTLSNRVSDLEKDEQCMRQRIEFLQSDIRGLLELIRRAVQENHWTLDDIKFFEIEHSDIPVPNNCTCDQEDTNPKKVQSLKSQIKQFQENERKMIACQKELEEKVTDLNSKLQTKEDIVKKYHSQVQNISDNIKKHPKIAEQICCSSVINDQEAIDIVLVTDIVESLLLEKNLEIENLQKCLSDAESNLAITVRDSNIHLNNFKTHLSEKCKAIQEMKQQMLIVQKESVEQQSALTAEIKEKDEIIMSLQRQMAAFQEQCRYVKMQSHFREDVIKEMRKELKQAVSKETYTTQNLVDVRTRQEDMRKSRNPMYQQNQIVSCLTRVKSFMEQEKDDISKLKRELETTIENLCCEKDKKQEYNVDKVKRKLAGNIEFISNVYSRKQEYIGIINSLLIQMENNNFDDEDLSFTTGIDSNLQFKLMDVLGTCAVETQITLDDIKDEMKVLLSSFKFRNQKYVDLNKEVVNVQNQLIKSREKIAESLNRSQLREEERIRHSNRIALGQNKLKDMKNEINLVKSRLSAYVTDLQTNENISSYTEICICNDLVYTVIEEIEQISSSLQIFEVQEYDITKDLEKLRNQFCDVDSFIKKLQEKIDEALSEHDIVEVKLSQKEQKLQRLETETDKIHSRIQNILESFFSAQEEVLNCSIMESQLYTQTLNEILQIKQDVCRLRNEHDELKCRLSQKSHYPECDKKTCLWKSRVIDLQDQVKILQHEAKCNEEANNFLRNNIQSMEEELHTTQTKADSFRRSHSIDIMELKKTIIELENTLKFQKEMESTLRRQLGDSEVALKKSKELLNSSHNDYCMEESLVHCGCYQIRHDTTTAPQVFKTVQSTIRSTKGGLQELIVEFKKLVCESSSSIASPLTSLMNLIDKLQKYESELDNCLQEFEELKNAIYSKDKLIENMGEAIKIQRDSIGMSQAELKELRQEYQDKINNQEEIISQYEKEKNELLKQNELQIQTIGHLQNAVVEAKKCIDQMGHRTLEKKAEAIRQLTIYAEETQSQYNECFAEAAKQDKLLELQRDAIFDLQQKISSIEQDNRLFIILIHIMYYSIIKEMQEQQLESRLIDIQALKNKINYIESKYLNAKKLLQEKEGKLQELRKEMTAEHKTKVRADKEIQCKIECKDKNCTTLDVVHYNEVISNNKEQSKNMLYQYDLQSEYEILVRENEDLKRQLQKYKLDFDIIDKELKTEQESNTYVQQVSFELQKLRDTECCLQYENQQLKSDLRKQTKQTENVLEKLELAQKNNTKFEKLMKKLDDKQTQINDLCSQITKNEIIIKKQKEVIEDLEKKFNAKTQQNKAYLAELNEAEEEMSTLHNRIQSLKTLLKEKSDDMAKLQVDYEVMKNNNSILRMENNNFEDRKKENVCQLQAMLKDLQRQLCFTENNYCRVTEDFNKVQEQLIKMTKREADLQECLTNMEKEYCSKILTLEKEKAKLVECLNKFRDELEENQRNHVPRSSEQRKLQDICKSYAEQLEILQQQVEEERMKVKKIEESNRSIIQQLQEENCVLVEEKSIIERNNCAMSSELQETNKLLLELKRECQLKNKSLACMSAELTETAMSRSELCNQSQYVVSCIRVWMQEQREYVNKLSAKLKSQQQEVLQSEFERKALSEEAKKLRRANHALMQKLKRMYKHSARNVRNVCVGCQLLPEDIDTYLPISSRQLSSQKKNIIKATRRVSVHGNGWWFPKMKYLVNELRKSSVRCNENCFNRKSADIGSEENHDCGYQSSTSK